MGNRLFFSTQDLDDIFEPVVEEYQYSENENNSDFIDINSDDFIDSMYNKVFAENKKAIMPMRDKDREIIKTFNNEKSFERAIVVCQKILADLSSEPSDVSSCCSKDTEIIVTCHNNLIEKKVPHVYKAGMLILSIIYRQ